MLVNVDGLRVLVTAGAGGAGRAIAETFAGDGARVHVCDIDEHALADLRAERPEIGTKLADVGDPAAVASLFDEIEAEHGAVDVLINNAGIAGPTAPVEELTVQDWNHVLAVNLSAQFYCIRRAVPAMKAARFGVIVNISSTSARTGLPLRVAYVASKHAVLGLTQTLARELGPFGIRVNAILPGWINNDRGRQVLKDKANALGREPQQLMGEMTEFISLRTMVEPEEIAAMAVFLASREGRHISGQLIGVCGNVEYER